MDTPDPFRDIRRVVDTLQKAPHFARVKGRDGAQHRIWANPATADFAAALRNADDRASAGLRGVLTASDLFIWQSTNLPHAEFERQTRIEGLRVTLRSSCLAVNEETVDQPEQFPWVFRDLAGAGRADIDERRETVAAWLHANPWLKEIYPQGFDVAWYL